YQAFSSFIEECGSAYERSQAQKLLFFDAAVQAETIANEAKEAQKTAEASVLATRNNSSSNISAMLSSSPLAASTSASSKTSSATFRGLRKSLFYRSSATQKQDSQLPPPPQTHSPSISSPTPAQTIQPITSVLRQ